MQSPHPQRHGGALALGLAAALQFLLVACGNGDASAPVEIRTLSSRADLVSGGDALVEIVLPAGASATGLKVTLGRRDISSAFAVGSDGRVRGLVTNLANGETRSRR